MDEITDEQIRELLNDVANYVPATAADLRDRFNALLDRIERAEKDAKEARQVSERDRCPSNESLRGTMDILEDARVNGGDMPISAGKAIELCETVIALRARVATLEAAGLSVLEAYSVDVFRTLSASSKLALAVIELSDALAGVRAPEGE